MRDSHSERGPTTAPLSRSRSSRILGLLSHAHTSRCNSALLCVENKERFMLTRMVRRVECVRRAAEQPPPHELSVSWLYLLFTSCSTRLSGLFVCIALVHLEHLECGHHVVNSGRKPTPTAVHLRCVCSALELEHKQGGEDRPSDGRTVATRCGRTLNAEQ